MYYQCINPGCNPQPFAVDDKYATDNEGEIQCGMCDWYCAPARGINTKVFQVTGHGYAFGVIATALISSNPNEQAILDNAGWGTNFVSVAVTFTSGGYYTSGYDIYGWHSEVGPFPSDLLQTVHQYIQYNFEKLAPGCTINFELRGDSFRVIGSEL